MFYMASVSLVAALIGCFLPMAWGDTSSFKIPNQWYEWAMLCGVGACLYSSINPSHRREHAVHAVAGALVCRLVSNFWRG